MFGVNWMQLLAIVATLGIGAVVVSYLFLRLFVWTKFASRSLEHIRRHALWTGILAWAVSGLHGANRAGIYDHGHVQPTDWSAIPWFAILGPVTAVIAVHAIGQSTWPAPKLPSRMAVLEFRRTRDYVEPVLGWTVAAIFTLAAAVIGFVFFAAGFTSTSSMILGGSGQSFLTQQGRVPGYILATALSVALLVLAVGTVLVMRLITSRRSLEALTPEQNKTLRTIGMNRLLRVSATVASGLAAIAGNFLMQPAPDSTATSWVNWLGIINAAVLIVMLFWKPPFLDAVTDDAGYNTLYVTNRSEALAAGDGPAAARLTNSASAVALPAAILGAGLGYAMHSWFGLVGIVAVSAVFVLLAYVGLEVILRRNYADQGIPRRTLGVLLPWPMYVAFAIAAASLVLALINAHGVAPSSSLNSWPGRDAPGATNYAPAIAALVVLAVGMAAMWFVLARASLNNAPAAFDRTLRRRSLFRIARTVTGAWFAILGLLLIMVPVAPDPHPLVPRFESGIFGVLCNVVAVLIVFYPLRAFTPADFTPGEKPSTSVSK